MPQPGTTLQSARGNYLVRSVIGAGVFGAVYECVGPFDQVYAVKVIRPANRPYAEVRHEWESEVRRLELEGRDPYEEILAYRCPALVQGMVVSRSLAIRIGGFNPSLTLLDDLDFALRLARSGPAAVCAEPLFRYRKEPRPWGPKESSRHHREMLRVLAEDASRPPKGRGKELLRANAAAHWKAVASAEWHAGNRPSSVVGLFRSAVARFVGP